MSKFLGLVRLLVIDDFINLSQHHVCHGCILFVVSYRLDPPSHPMGCKTLFRGHTVLVIYNKEVVRSKTPTNPPIQLVKESSQGTCKRAHRYMVGAPRLQKCKE